MRVGSLFSGIGGFDLAFERAGCEIAWQVEIDDKAGAVLQKHWPNGKRLSDVKEVGKANLEPVDIITGGFPCQDLSVAGKRKGLAGERSGLWFEFHRIVSELTPRWVVIENVPGLLSGCGCFSCQVVGRIVKAHARIRRRKGGEACDMCIAGIRMLRSHNGRNVTRIVQGLVQLGYCVSWRILDAQYSHLAQRRERVFIVGSLGDGRCAEVLFESESVCWNPPPSREARERVAAPITASFAKHHGRSAGNNGAAENMISGTLSSGAHPGGHNGQDDGRVIVHALRSEGADASEDGPGRGTPLVAMPLLGKGNSSHAEDLQTYVAATLKQRGRGACDEVMDNLQVVATLNSGGDSGGFRTEPGEHLIAFSSKDSGNDAGILAPTLRSMNYDDSHINGGGQVAIAFDRAQITSSENGSQPKDGDPAAGLHSEAPLLAFSAGQGASAATLGIAEEQAPTLKGANSGLNSVGSVQGSFGVRRLTPRECERLQGFPDDFTKGLSDSARYRCLGNAVAVPVVEWIARRIISASS